MMETGEDGYPGLIFNSIFNAGSSSKIRTYGNTVDEAMESVTYTSGNRLRGSVDVANAPWGYSSGGKGSKGCKHRKSNKKNKGYNHDHGSKGGKGGKGSIGSFGYYGHSPCDQSPQCINYGGNCCHPPPTPTVEPIEYTTLEWCEDDYYDLNGPNYSNGENPNYPNWNGPNYDGWNYPGGDDSKYPGWHNPSNPTSSNPTNKPTSRPSSSPATFEEPSISPTVTIAPSGSSAPSSKPSVSQKPSSSNAPSNMPSTSLEPSRSNAPSDEPTITPSTDSNAPGPTLIAGNNIANGSVANGSVGDGNVGAKNYCMIFSAKYETVQIDEPPSEIRTDNVILLWASGTDRDEEATAIAALNSIVPPPIYESDTDKYNLNVVFKIKPSNAVMDKDDIDDDQDFDLEDVSKHLDKIVNPPVVLAVAGCANEAQEIATEYYYDHEESNSRKTQVIESESKLAVMRQWICVYSDGSAENSCVGDECSVSCKTSINYMGNLEYKDIEPIIAQSLTDYFSMIDDVSTWYEPQVIDYTIEEGSTDSNNNGIAKATDVTEIEQQKSSTKAGPFIGAAAGLLALLLLLLLFVRRRNRYDDDEVSHLKLDDDDDDDTFVKEFGLGGDGGSDDNSIPRNEYQSRDIHIVGEDDSVISHWTGYTGRDHPSNGNYEMEYIKNGPLNGIATDVHQCASATCEICAKNRQAGLSFVSAGVNGESTRSRSLPSDASREYPVEDTVEL